MNHRKKLAYPNNSGEVKRPKKTKLLFFKKVLPFVLAFSAISSCGAANAHLRNRSSLNETTIRTENKERCTFDSKRMLSEGENVRETVCRESDMLVLTNTSLHVIYFNTETESVEGLPIRLHSSRTDLRPLLRLGFEDWTHSRENTYFLTSNGEITVVPLEEMGDTLQVFKVPGSVRGAKMTHFENNLFVVTADGKGRVLDAEKGTRISDFSVEFDITASDFFVSKGSLFFGEENGERIKIRD